MLTSLAGMPEWAVSALLAKTFGAVVLTAVLAGCQSSAPTPPPVPFAYTTSTKPCHARHADVADPQGWLPDASCTPGAVNPAVTVGQLCPVAHTRQWRPATDYTNALKKDQLANRYDYVDTSGGHTFTAADVEEDHLIALRLGGAPRNSQNLWPEPHASFNHKDAVEAAAQEAVCRGALTLPQAQQGIAANWIELGKRLHVKY